MVTRPNIILAQIVNGSLGRKAMNGRSPEYGSGDCISSFETRTTAPRSSSPVDAGSGQSLQTTVFPPLCKEFDGITMAAILASNSSMTYGL